MKYFIIAVAHSERFASVSVFICPHREQVNKRRLKDIVKEFALLSGGLQGTEYAASY